MKNPLRAAGFFIAPMRDRIASSSNRENVRTCWQGRAAILDWLQVAAKDKRV
jgi:hypothetical protein